MQRRSRQSLEEMMRVSLWAKALTPSEFNEVRREVYERQVPKGGHIVRAGDPADHWYGVIEGLIKMSITRADGRHTTLTGVTAGGWAGEGSLLRRGVWRYDAIAVRPTRVACMPRFTFERLLANSPAFGRFLLQHLNARLSLFIGMLEFDRLFGPDTRIAHCLASLFDPDLYPEPGRTLELTQEEVGLLSGVSRQRAHAALHRLSACGLLRIEFGRVVILDVEGLRRFQSPNDASDGQNRRRRDGWADPRRLAPLREPTSRRDGTTARTAECARLP
ncbi:MAG TPA: Crp/Fnr family transcriptional regulator [Burkholderiaceae bacterium]|jgi:CRP-like cAMP-binding protein|nr:Crp/Fnr family transcriptional regulator [Burkholderiaceae bacterium]